MRCHFSLPLSSESLVAMIDSSFPESESTLCEATLMTAAGTLFAQLISLVALSCNAWEFP